MTTSIRLGTSADAGVLAHLLTDFNHEFGAAVPEPDVLVRRFEEMLAGSALFAILAVGDRPLGFALVSLRPTPYYDGPLAVLDELYVDASWRGRGIGTALLNGAIDEALARAVGEMHINVDEIDVDARRFYERHGFVNIEPGADYRMLCYLREL